MEEPGQSYLCNIEKTRFKVSKVFHRVTGTFYVSTLHHCWNGRGGERGKGGIKEWEGEGDGGGREGRTVKGNRRGTGKGKGRGKGNGGENGRMSVECYALDSRPIFLYISMYT